MVTKMYSSKLCAKHCLIILTEYKYGYHKQLKNGIERWKCTRKTCTCFMKNDFANRKIKVFNSHNHVKESDLDKQIMNNWVKKEAVNNPEKKVDELIICGEKEFNFSIEYKDKKCMMKNIYHARTKSKSRKM